MATNETQKFTIEVEMQTRWIPHFLAMLKKMQQYGSLGCSREITFYSDGDGDFRPYFEWDETLPSEADPIKEINGNLYFDAG